LLLETSDITNYELYRAAQEKFHVPPERRGVPTLVIGDTVLVGSREIPEQLPGLIDRYLASGGLDYPDIPGLVDVVAEAKATAEAVETATATAETPATATTPVPTSQRTPAATPAATPTPAPVYLAFFFGPGCPKCQEARLALAQIQESHPNLHIDSFDIREHQPLAYWLAERYGVDKAQWNQVPAVYVGKDVLTGGAVTARAMLELVEKYARGGANAVWAVGPMEAVPVRDPLADRIAIAVLVFMLGSLLFLGVRLIQDRQAIVELNPDLPDGVERRAVPILALIGLGIAGYLTYVKIAHTETICGPIGDCDAVQTSPYSEFLGIPVALLGILGYVGILVAWLWSEIGKGWLTRLAPLGMLTLALVGVAFSAYLTYLELFVIGAVCSWCVASAITVTAVCWLVARPILAERR